MARQKGRRTFQVKSKVLDCAQSVPETGANKSFPVVVLRVVTEIATPLALVHLVGVRIMVE